MNNYFRVKRLDTILAEERNSKDKLKRLLGTFDIVLLGIGAIIGAGIFATIGTASGDLVRSGAGPSLIVSFVITGGLYVDLLHYAMLSLHLWYQFQVVPILILMQL
jgi:APA family basic amino acid/polyamine antiporter